MSSSRSSSSVPAPTPAPASSPPVPSVVEELRRKLVIKLVNERYQGNQSAFARALGRSTAYASYISRIISAPDAPGHKRIKEDLALQIEEALELPRGYLVNPVENRSRPRALLPETVRKVWVISLPPPIQLWEPGKTRPMGATDLYSLQPWASKDPQAYVIPIVDELMSPRYDEGEFVLVLPGTTPQPGDYVFIRLVDRPAHAHRTPRESVSLLRRFLSERAGTRRFTTLQAPGSMIHIPVEDIAWMHYVAHAIPPQMVEREEPRD